MTRRDATLSVKPSRHLPSMTTGAAGHKKMMRKKIHRGGNAEHHA